MKNNILAILALLAFSFSLKAQQFVSTEPANRNVILEEFTGRNSGYCTDGHRIANELMAAHPGRLWAINIHAGGYAPTSYPNMITQDGNTIHGGFSISGYPTGVINRTTGNGIDRGQWGSQANNQLNQASECNIAGMAVINPQTRMVTITVEVYYTGNSTIDQNYLTVAMLQDSILGSQADYGNYNPTQWVGNQYCHMHVLRDVISESAWGDPIYPTTQGTLITRTYEYQIPEVIGSPNGAEVVLEHIHFLAFVSQQFQGTPTRPILNVCELGTSYLSCYINTSSNPTNGGTVTGGGTYQLGQQCTVSATPASNFTFLRWTENGSQVSTNANYTFTVTGNRTLVAQFQAQPQNYNISISANPTNGGTVTGGGTYQQGQQCTVSATPASNFTFLWWTENGSQVSTYADYTFTVTGNRTLVAEFNEIIPEYTITVNADPTNGGEVSGGGIYSLGATCVLTASPNPDFVFENWTRNDIEVSTSPSFDFEVTRNAEYVAHFVQDANHCTITAIADPFEGGAVSGSGTYELGIQCVLNAFPAVGFEFVNWTTQDGNQVSTNAQFGFTVTSNAVYIAHFRRIVNHYTITASVEPAGAGSVIGAATFDEGDSCTLIAMPNPTYSFVSWTENGIVVSTDDHYTFTVDRDRNLVAVFSQGLFYTISASAGANGTISPEGDVFVEPGEDKTFAMIPNSGCSVQKVVVDGVDVGPVESYTFRSVNSDHTIHVQFSGLGVDNHTSLDLKVYPNPAKESLIVEGENMKRIAVFNLLGVQMASQEVNDSHTSLNIDSLTKGTYILKVEYADGTVGYMRFVAAD